MKRAKSNEFLLINNTHIIGLSSVKKLRSQNTQFLILCCLSVLFCFCISGCDSKIQENGEKGCGIPLDNLSREVILKQMTKNNSQKMIGEYLSQAKFGWLMNDGVLYLSNECKNAPDSLEGTLLDFSSKPSFNEIRIRLDYERLSLFVSVNNMDGSFYCAPFIHECDSCQFFMHYQGPDGNLRFKGSFKNGYPQNLFSEWYENGSYKVFSFWGQHCLNPPCPILIYFFDVDGTLLFEQIWGADSLNNGMINNIKEHFHPEGGEVLPEELKVFISE